MECTLSTSGNSSHETPGDEEPQVIMECTLSTFDNSSPQTPGGEELSQEPQALVEYTPSTSCDSPQPTPEPQTPETIGYSSTHSVHSNINYSEKAGLQVSSVQPLNTQPQEIVTAMHPLLLPPAMRTWSLCRTGHMGAVAHNQGHPSYLLRVTLLIFLSIFRLMRKRDFTSAWQFSVKRKRQGCLLNNWMLISLLQSSWGHWLLL